MSLDVAVYVLIACVAVGMGGAFVLLWALIR